MEQILEKLKKKQDLTFLESKTAFEILMTGKANDDEIFNFLTLLSEKGEVSDEIAGGVFVLREKSKRVNVSDCIDTCGTGGDGMNTLNISTASALLLASMGTKVAKHGNKAVSSKCGSGDVLEALKIKIDLEPQDIEKEINTNNFGFMFAPNYHSAMRFVGPVRKKIGKRTIFNMIGPLSNPALVERQVVGVFDKKLLKIFAEGLKNLNLKFAWIVNSEYGLYEISPYAKTNVIQLKDSQISEIKIDLEPKEIENQINKNNFGFMFAPNYHSAMKFVGPTRKKIGKSTIFVFAYGEISSRPSSLFTIQANFNFKFCKAFAKIFNNFLSKTPTTCLSTNAGLLNGPIILNIVLFPIFFLVGPTNFIAL